MLVRRLVCSLVLTLLAAGLAVGFTYPLAFALDSVGRIDTGDGQWSLWCVTWVARALATDPGDLFHANIFHPHRYTLAYSEPNIVPGLLGVPAYLATGSPYATHNSVVLLAFVFSFLAAYGLAFYLTRSVPAALASAIAFAYCPFIFARTAHIQLLITFGMPWSLHMMHRLIDRPTWQRGLALGLVLALQGLACAYYGIFAGLTVGLGVIFYAVSRRLWRQWSYWGSVALAAAVSILIVAPFFAPFIYVQQELGFARTIEDANMYSADLGAWLASSARAHRWWLPSLTSLGGWNEVLFPGVLTTVLGLTGLWLGYRAGTHPNVATNGATTAPTAAPALTSAPAPAPAATPATGAIRGDERQVPETTRRVRETTLFYAIVGAVGFWTSFGPAAGLYTALYYTIPVFSFLRAPGRVGIVVAMVLAVLMAIAVSELLRRRPLRTVRIAGAALAVALSLELLNAPLSVVEAEPVHPAYQMLAKLPRGPVAEFPFYYERYDFPRHAWYMLQSTAHWQPLINGYSDHIPGDFREMVRPLSSFPSRGSFRRLRERKARYVLFHLNRYDRRSRERLIEQLDEYRDYLTPLVRDDRIWMYAITRWPDS